MANNYQEVPLPDSVQTLINTICDKQGQPQPDNYVRRRLDSIGEERALDILNTISKSTIKRSLGGFIKYLINNGNKASSPSPSKPNVAPPSATCLHQATEHQGQGQSSYSSADRWEENCLTPAMVALGELEFRKAFLLLSYIGSHSLENAITAEKIRSLKELPMATFEKEIWEDVGKTCLQDEKERQLYVEWDSGRPHIYHCHVSSEGSLRFKGPMLHSAWTHLQKSLGDDNVLLVKFDGEKNVIDERITKVYMKFGKEGIRVGLRLYRFFVFKDGGKEENKKDPTTSSVKCYFVRVESYSSADERASYILSNKTMSEARSLFMHVHTLANMDKYMARFSLILSKTLTLKIDWAAVNVQRIEDVYCQDENGSRVYDHNGKPRIHTDGTGFISEDLAVLCPSNVVKGRDSNNKYNKEIPNLVDLEAVAKAMGKAELSSRQPPLLIQCRLFHMGCAVKGTLLVNRKLPPRTIQVRPSMIKVETDTSLVNTESINSVEVVTASNKPNRAYLSKYLIALLSYGGVPNEFFMDVLRCNLEEVAHVYSRKRPALRVSVNNGDMDEYNAAGMILSGIPLDEPFLQYHLSMLATEEKNKFRGGRLYVPDCFYVMGTVDPTGCLERNEVCIIHENGQITGDVLVYRNPGLHYGDIHVMHAKYVEELESYVGHSKFAIFFPSVGPRSVADEIAGGDFDGDMYWVSKNPQLLEYFRKSEAWMERAAPANSVSSNSSVKKPREFSADKLEEELFKLYLDARFHPSIAIGAAADCWMALMDRLLTLRNGCTKGKEMDHLKENILKLIDIYYAALDAPKKGEGKIRVPDDLAVEMYPHYMEKDKSFTSTSILGIIYDEVGRWKRQDWKGKEITKLACFDVEIPRSCMEKWEALYEEYRKRMANVMKNETDKDIKHHKAKEIIKIYKQKFYGAATMEDSPKSIRDIYNEALAVYHVTYDYAIRISGRDNEAVKRCGFAWNVAGSALTRFYAIKQNRKALSCAPSVLREIC